VESAHVQSLKAVTCRGDTASDKHACYSATGSDKSAGLVPNMATITEVMLDHVLEDRELNKAIPAVDDAWSVEAMELSPTEIPVTTCAPFEAPRMKSSRETVGSDPGYQSWTVLNIRYSQALSSMTIKWPVANAGA
jgi:hypothetical protein